MSQRMNVRLSHLTALAVMIALVGAMFASVGSVRGADEEEGDISSNSGVCLLDSANDDHSVTTPAWRLFYDSDASGTVDTNDNKVQVWDKDSDADTDGDQSLWVDVTSSLCAGKPDNSTSTEDGGDANTDPDPAVNRNRNFKITPNGTLSPIVELQSPTVTLLLSDTDGKVNDDSSLTVTLLASNFNGYGTDNDRTTPLRLDYVRVSGELDAPAGTPDVSDGNVTLTGTWSGTITIPDGTTAQEYTVSARVSYETEATQAEADRKKVAQSRTFTVGDGGTNAAAASLSLGNEKEDNTLRVGDQAKAEDGMEAASGGDVWLKLTALNSLGSPANPASLTSITVIAPGATVTIHDAEWDGELGSLKPGGKNGGSDSSGANSATTDMIVVSGVNTLLNVDHTKFIKVERAGSPPKPGSVDVYAIVIGKDGGPRSEVVPVSFTGAGATVEVGDAKAVAPGKKTEFTIKAKDAGGSDASLSQASFRVTNEDGKRAEGKVDVSLGNVGDSTATPLDNDPNAKAGIVTVASTAAAGVYMVTVSLPGVADSSATTEVIVAGTAKSVELEADPESGDAAEQDVIKVTATLLDDNGANVADGTRVEFTVLGRSLSAIGPGHAPIETSVQKALDSNDEVIELSVTSGGVKTKDGQASVNYVVTGSGTAVISATSEGGSASGVLRVTTTDSAAEAADAMPEEEASVSCLSELSGFATWSCGVEADASEIFDMVSGRGVTALHLWNGSTWVRYSVVDGTMVPGSSDFMVTESDILYISN